MQKKNGNKYESIVRVINDSKHAGSNAKETLILENLVHRKIEVRLEIFPRSSSYKLQKDHFQLSNKMKKHVELHCDSDRIENDGSNLSYLLVYIDKKDNRNRQYATDRIEAIVPIGSPSSASVASETIELKKRISTLLAEGGARSPNINRILKIAQENWTEKQEEQSRTVLCLLQQKDEKISNLEKEHKALLNSMSEGGSNPVSPSLQSTEHFTQEVDRLNRQIRDQQTQIEILVKANQDKVSVIPPTMSCVEEQREEVNLLMNTMISASGSQEKSEFLLQQRVEQLQGLLEASHENAKENEKRVFDIIQLVQKKCNEDSFLENQSLWTAADAEPDISASSLRHQYDISVKNQLQKYQNQIQHDAERYQLKLSMLHLRKNNPNFMAAATETTTLPTSLMTMPDIEKEHSTLYEFAENLIQRVFKLEKRLFGQVHVAEMFQDIERMKKENERNTNKGDTSNIPWLSLLKITMAGWLDSAMLANDCPMNISDSSKLLKAVEVTSQKLKRSKKKWKVLRQQQHPQTQLRKSCEDRSEIFNDMEFEIGYWIDKCIEMDVRNAKALFSRDMMFQNEIESQSEQLTLAMDKCNRFELLIQELQEELDQTNQLRHEETMKSSDEPSLQESCTSLSNDSNLQQQALSSSITIEDKLLNYVQLQAQNEALQQQIQILQDSINGTNPSSSSANTSVAPPTIQSLSYQLQMSFQDNIRLKQNILVKEKEICHLQRTHQQSAKSISQVRKKSENLQAEKQKDRKQNSGLEREIRALTNQMKHLEMEQSQVEQKYIALAAENKSLKKLQHDKCLPVLSVQDKDTIEMLIQTQFKTIWPQLDLSSMLSPLNEDNHQQKMGLHCYDPIDAYDDSTSTLIKYQVVQEAYMMMLQKVQILSQNLHQMELTSNDTTRKLEMYSKRCREQYEKRLGVLSQSIESSNQSLLELEHQLNLSHKQCEALKKERNVTNFQKLQSLSEEIHHQFLQLDTKLLRYPVPNSIEDLGDNTATTNAYYPTPLDQYYQTKLNCVQARHDMLWKWTITLIYEIEDINIYDDQQSKTTNKKTLVIGNQHSRSTNMRATGIQTPSGSFQNPPSSSMMEKKLQEHCAWLEEQLHHSSTTNTEPRSSSFRCFANHEEEKEELIRKNHHLSHRLSSLTEKMESLENREHNDRQQCQYYEKELATMTQKNTQLGEQLQSMEERYLKYDNEERRNESFELALHEATLEISDLKHQIISMKATASTYHASEGEEKFRHAIEMHKEEIEEIKIQCHVYQQQLECNELISLKLKQNKDTKEAGVQAILTASKQHQSSQATTTISRPPPPPVHTTVSSSSFDLYLLDQPKQPSRDTLVGESADHDGAFLLDEPLKQDGKMIRELRMQVQEKKDLVSELREQIVQNSVEALALQEKIHELSQVIEQHRGQGLQQLSHRQENQLRDLKLKHQQDIQLLKNQMQQCELEMEHMTTHFQQETTQQLSTIHEKYQEQFNTIRMHLQLIISRGSCRLEELEANKMKASASLIQESLSATILKQLNQILPQLQSSTLSHPPKARNLDNDVNDDPYKLQYEMIQQELKDCQQQLANTEKKQQHFIDQCDALSNQIMTIKKSKTQHMKTLEKKLEQQQSHEVLLINLKEAANKKEKLEKSIREYRKENQRKTQFIQQHKEHQKQLQGELEDMRAQNQSLAEKLKKSQLEISRKDQMLKRVKTSQERMAQSSKDEIQEKEQTNMTLFDLQKQLTLAKNQNTLLKCKMERHNLSLNHPWHKIKNESQKLSKDDLNKEREEWQSQLNKETLMVKKLKKEIGRKNQSIQCIKLKFDKVEQEYHASRSEALTEKKQLVRRHKAQCSRLQTQLQSQTKLSAATELDQADDSCQMPKPFLSEQLKQLRDCIYCFFRDVVHMNVRLKSGLKVSHEDPLNDENKETDPPHILLSQLGRALIHISTSSHTLQNILSRILDERLILEVEQWTSIKEEDGGGNHYVDQNNSNSCEEEDITAQKQNKECIQDLVNEIQYQVRGQRY